MKYSQYNFAGSECFPCRNRYIQAQSSLSDYVHQTINLISFGEQIERKILLLVRFALPLHIEISKSEALENIVYCRLQIKTPKVFHLYTKEFIRNRPIQSTE
jgi:hypothetical protein